MNIPLDKQKHMTVGFLIALLTTLFLSNLCDFVIAGGFGFILATVAGVWKELRDGKTDGATVEKMDAVATAVGGIIGSFFAWFIMWL